jgi:uncharacterized protein (TIGR01319 family)
MNGRGGDAVTVSLGKQPKTVLGLDCGSTTTKAALFAANAEGQLAFVDRREAPTTVEAPFEDVTIGVREAVLALERATGRRLLRPERDGGFLTPASGPRRGVDAVVATSSAGGGLRILVAGLMRAMTAESAERAALGAGGIVTEVIAVDDGRRTHEKLERIRQVEPDMIVLAGGVDGGNVSHVVGLADLILTAGARPRFAVEESDHLPIVFAGNREAAGQVREILGSDALFSSVSNLRPRLEEENVLPAKLAIQQLFMTHVMAHAPNYRRLRSWVDVILPTPAAVGLAVEMVATSLGDPILAVDVGGATTDVFSVHEGRLYRSVSANLGLSYSALSLLDAAGEANIRRWLRHPWEPRSFGDTIANKAIRPTTLPETVEELELEQALARETLRLSLIRHQSIVVGLRGIHQQRQMGELFEQTPTGLPLLDLGRVKAIIGSGGVLSHAPEPWQVVAMLVDGLAPKGVTRLLYDRGFLFPHVGAMASVSPKAAREMLFGPALVSLGTVAAPVLAGGRREQRGRPAVRVSFTPPGEEPREFLVHWGELRLLPLPSSCRASLRLEPCSSSVDAGSGPGVAWSGMVEGGSVGIAIDARGRQSHGRVTRSSSPGGAVVASDWATAARQAGLPSGGVGDV